MDYSLLVVFYKRGFGQNLSHYEDSESLEHSQLSGDHDPKTVGRFSDIDMMPGNTQQTHSHLIREEDKLFAIAENEEDKEEDDDGLLPHRSPGRPASRYNSPNGKERGRRQQRQETPGNEESKEGTNPFRVKPNVRGHSEIELRHMSTI
jgi:hypothetical protein